MGKVSIFSVFFAGLVPLLFVIMTSGCTVPGLGIELPIDIPGITDVIDTGVPSAFGTEHDVIVIKSLDAVPATIGPHQSVKVIAYIENKGDEMVTANVRLYDYCYDMFEMNWNDNVCSNGKWHGVDDEGFAKKAVFDPIEKWSGVIYYHPKETKADVLTCVVSLFPGEVISVKWTLKAKDVKLKTVCPPDGIKVSATYDYETNSLTTLSLIRNDELKRTLAERTYKPEESYITLGMGPIKPVITVEDKQPVPVFSGARTIIALKLANMGSGEIAEKNEIDWKDIKIYMGKNLEDKVKKDACEFPSDSIKGEPKGEKEGENEARTRMPVMVPKADSSVMKFIGKSTAKAQCRVDLSDYSIVTTATEKIEAEVGYTYSVKKSVPVTVAPN